MEINSSDKYMNMEEYSQKWYFYDEEIRVPSEDIKQIKPLLTRYSEILWQQYISKYNSHFMLLDSKDKISMLRKQDYNWLEDWNSSIYNNFRDYLSKALPYNHEDTIIVFWSKESAVETTWRIFIKHWANFLFDDEEVVLINTTNEIVLVFCSDGVLLKGNRVLEL